MSDPTGVLGSGARPQFHHGEPAGGSHGDAQGRATAFAAPYQTYGGHQAYALGTASVAQSGTDPETGLVWGRWAGGMATVTAGGGRSSHSPSTKVEPALRLLGRAERARHRCRSRASATYDLIGRTSPTDSLGHVGTLNNATLAANFTQRTVDLGVNLTIAGQTINGSAAGVPIYREQYFSAFRGTVPPGLPVPQLLNITCQPACAEPGGLGRRVLRGAQPGRGRG